MGAVIKADIRRLLKTKSFYICLAILFGFVLLIAAGASYITHKSSTQMLEMLEESVGRDLGGFKGSAAMLDLVGLGPQERIRRAVSFEWLCVMPFRGALPHLLLVIFLALYLGRDYATGYMKNLLALPGYRKNWFVSKVISTAAAMLAMYMSLLLGAGAGTLVLGNPLRIDAAKLASYLLSHLLISAALSLLVFFILTGTQNKTAALVLGILLVNNVQAIVLALVDLTRVFPFKLEDYNLMRWAHTIAFDRAVQPMMIWVASGTALVSLVLSLVFLLKRDMKM